MIGSADLAPIILIIVFAAIIVMWRDDKEGFGIVATASYDDLQTCPDGTRIGVAESCNPVTCWNGTKVTNAALCPPETKDCWDGSKVGKDASCPPQVTCWNGNKVTNVAMCPPQPSGPAPVVPSNCATVDDINRLIKALDNCGPAKPPPSTKPPGWKEPDVATRKTVKEDLFKKCPDGSFVAKGGVCGKDQRLSNEGWFTLKFGPVDDQIWIDSESTRLRTRFPPGTPFKFLIEDNVPGQAVFNNAKTVDAYSIKVTGPAAKKIVRGERPEIAITTLIYAVTLAAGRETPNKLPDAIGTSVDIKKETLGTYNDAIFKNSKTGLSLAASGAAFKRVSAMPNYVYFRVGTASGAAKATPYFRMMRVAGAAVKDGLLPLKIQQYQESRNWWVPQLGPTPHIPMNKRITILELKPQWKNADEGPVLKGEIQKGVRLPDALISRRFVPQKTIRGTGAGQYQEVFDQNSMQMGKYYIKTNKFELRDANGNLIPNARLQCPPGRPMRKNTSCGLKKP